MKFIARILHWLATPFRAVDARCLAIARALVDPEARKAAALMLMAGAGMMWTLIVIAVLVMLHAFPRYVFWLGAGGWVIVLIVVTGYGAMLYKRSIRISRGGIEIADADPVTATAAVSTGASAPAASDGTQPQTSSRGGSSMNVGPLKENM